jgi:uncharacterized membrane protein HdeD (DUF308 family)
MSTNEPMSAETFAAAVKKSLHDHWRLFLIEGVILILLGLAAIVVPPLAGLATTIILGWLFLIGGAVGLVSTVGAHQAPGFGWSLLSAIVAILAGGVLLWDPMQGLASVTYVLIAFFIIDGVLVMILALQHRRELSGRWEWMMIGGIIDLILAAIIVAGLPGTLAWALGLLVGIDLLWGGMSLVGMAMAARSETT